MKALRILHVIPSVSPSQGGPSHAVVMMESALSGVGIHVDTATTNDDGPGRHLGHRTATAHPHGKAVRWYFHKWTEAYKIAPRLWPWLLARVRGYEVVHIHALFSFASTVAAWSARARGVPYVVRPLGVLAHYGMQGRRPRLKRLSFKLIEAPILRHAAAVHFTSTAERDEALALGVPFRSVVIPLAVPDALPGEAARFLRTLQPPAVGLKLLFLSRLDPKKNLEALIPALAQLLHRGVPATLFIAGSGPKSYEDQLRRLAAEHAVDGHIRWLGQVEGQHKADVLQSADVFVLPSLSENFGIAVAEALAAGLPCVVGRGVALADAVQRTGAGLVTEPDIQAVAAALVEIAASAERRAAMSAAARTLAAQEFSTAAMAQRLVAMYRSVARPPLAHAAESAGCP